MSKKIKIKPDSHKNQDGSIERFYVDPKTGNLVDGVDKLIFSVENSSRLGYYRVVSIVFGKTHMIPDNKKCFHGEYLILMDDCEIIA